jgi:hypothetical protein
MEWDSIISYTSVLREIDLLSPYMARSLEFYEAYTEMRTTGGGVRLERLLEQADLEPELRVRVLHAIHIIYVYQSRYDQAL